MGPEPACCSRMAHEPAELGFVARKLGFVGETFMSHVRHREDGQSGRPRRGQEWWRKFQHLHATGAMAAAIFCNHFLSEAGPRCRPAMARKRVCGPRAPFGDFSALDPRQWRDSPARRGAERAVSSHFPIIRALFIFRRISREFPEAFDRSRWDMMGHFCPIVRHG